LKIVLPPNKSRILYFITEYDQIRWYQAVVKAIGQRNIEDHYDLKTDQVIGQG